MQYINDTPLWQKQYQEAVVSWFMFTKKWKKYSKDVKNIKKYSQDAQKIKKYSKVIKRDTNEQTGNANFPNITKFQISDLQNSDF